jgi:hypothetical protein
MFKMLAQLWAALSVFFTALEKGGNAVNHLADWAEESAAKFADEARLDRQRNLIKMQRKHAEELAKLNAAHPEQASATASTTTVQ